ncbi:hypothetical protein [Maritimibacter sp. HL-12]|uniref:hypothetical protein n=1 Tax=Maritimibacter sp. HL-12 TaxID=1162418 RepID=UPI0020CB2F78|nr:hypothetical protein [Maritimibacter sp. HL-12]
MMMINLAKAERPMGEPVMTEDELAVFTASFEKTGFTGGINWYRNLDRNWQILAEQTTRAVLNWLADHVPA